MLNKLFAAGIGNRKAAANLSSEVIGDFYVPRNRFDPACLRVNPERMRPALSLEIAAVLAQVREEAAAFHSTTTVSLSASGGIARSPSARRSSRINAMASVRLCFASSFVRP